MAEELAHFDLQKEKELKQVLLEYTAAQLERHEKVHGNVTVVITIMHNYNDILWIKINYTKAVQIVREELRGHLCFLLFHTSYTLLFILCINEHGYKYFYCSIKNQGGRVSY